MKLEDGATCEALAVKCGGPGSKTLVSIRPERVSVSSEPGPNSTTAQVLELIYLGDHIRCRLNVHGNDEFVVKVPNAAGHSIWLLAKPHKSHGTPKMRAPLIRNNYLNDRGDERPAHNKSSS